MFTISRDVTNELEKLPTRLNLNKEDDQQISNFFVIFDTLTAFTYA